MQEIFESDLIARSKHGDQDALSELFRRHYGASLRIAFGILRNSEDTHDAVQTAYLQAYRSLTSFRGEGGFKTWITRIVINSCFLQLRESKRRATWVGIESRNGPGLGDVLPSRALTPEKSAWCLELSSAFSSAVVRLPKHLREPYTLFAVSGLSLREVAKVLGLTIAGTKTRLFRARAGIRVSLRPVWCPNRNQKAYI